MMGIMEVLSEKNESYNSVSDRSLVGTLALKRASGSPKDMIAEYMISDQ
jgi:hypothetical protein